MKNKSLPEAIKNELFSNSLDISIDYTELIIDSNLSNEILKDIPLVKSIYASAKIVGSIRNFYTTKKILTFLKQFQMGNIDSDKLEKFKNEFNENESYSGKVINLIIQMNDRFIDASKSKIFANLFINYINTNIDWSELITLIYVLDKIQPSLFEVMHKYFTSGLVAHNPIISEIHESLCFSCGIGYRSGTAFWINILGQKLYAFGIAESFTS
ncbi:MAG: hypothetical protein GXO85_02160 [Chlorobi bacterium]|nr:hypothetical protein [Chlorobiota bacterium]